MLLKPCLHCTFRNSCEIRDDIRRRAKGLPFTVANFKCAKRDTAWRIGQRVQATFYEIAGYGNEGEWYRFEDHTGTVIGHKTGKVVVWLDVPLGVNEGDDAKRRDIVKVWPDRSDLQALDEPDATLCTECRKPTGRDYSGDWHCDVCGDHSSLAQCGGGPASEVQ